MRTKMTVALLVCTLACALGLGLAGCGGAVDSSAQDAGQQAVESGDTAETDGKESAVNADDAEGEDATKADADKAAKEEAQVGKGESSTSKEDKSDAEDADAEEHTSKKEPSEEEEPAPRSVGSEDGSVFSAAVSNQLGEGIVSLKLRVSGYDDYAENLLTEDETITAGEVVRLYVPKMDEGTFTYDLQIVLSSADEGERTLEFIDALSADRTSVTLLEADGVAYVEYAAESGETGSTKEEALARKSEQEVAANVEYVAEDIYEDYYEPESYGYEETYVPYEAPVAPVQSQDSCLTDVVLR